MKSKTEYIMRAITKNSILNMRYLMCGLFLFGLTSPSEGQAQDLKVAYVNMPRVLNEVEDGKSAKTKLKKNFEQKQSKLRQMEQKLRTKKEQFDAQAPMMKAEQRQTKAQELQKEFITLQQTLEQQQQDLMQQEVKLTNEIAAKIRSTIAKVGDRDGYDLILDIGETVLYYKRHKDITDEVVKLYNLAHPKKK